ncbi:hypothetical protein MAHJHV63_49930 [Mycobacterium avium subsp. hominissuis]
MGTPEVDVVILVGGKGTRLRPLTLSAPTRITTSTSGVPTSVPPFYPPPG